MAKIILSDIISTLPLFLGINEQEKATLLGVARIRNLPRGQILFLQGDPITCFYVVCRGTVQMFRETPDGHEITPDICISGDSLCPSEIIDSKPIYKVNARAVEDTVLLEVPMQWLKQNLQNFDHLILKLFTDISQRLQRTTVEVERQTTMSAPQLISCFLYELCVLYDFDPRGFELPYSKTLIASRLGMELETFSRSLHKLKEYGIIVQGTHVSMFNNHTDKRKKPVCGRCSSNGVCTQHNKLEQKMSHTPSTQEAL